MNPSALARIARSCAAGLFLGALGACSALRPAAAPHPAFYSLDGAQSLAPVAVSAGAPTLIINPPQAAAGYDSPRLIYVREAHKLEYFASSAWVEPPARMLAPLLVTAIANTGAFGSVVHKPGGAAGELRLDTEVIRLQHDFRTSPSQVRFTLRVHLIDGKTRRILAWQEFDAMAATTSEDPYGGVVAANRVVQSVLARVAIFCAQGARSRLEKNTP